MTNQIHKGQLFVKGERLFVATGEVRPVNSGDVVLLGGLPFQCFGGAALPPPALGYPILTEVTDIPEKMLLWGWGGSAWDWFPGLHVGLMATSEPNTPHRVREFMRLNTNRAHWTLSETKPTWTPGEVAEAEPHVYDDTPDCPNCPHVPPAWKCDHEAARGSIETGQWLFGKKSSTVYRICQESAAARNGVEWNTQVLTFPIRPRPGWCQMCGEERGETWERDDGRHECGKCMGPFTGTDAKVTTEPPESAVPAQQSSGKCPCHGVHSCVGNPNGTTGAVEEGPPESAVANLPTHRGNRHAVYRPVKADVQWPDDCE